MFSTDDRMTLTAEAAAWAISHRQMPAAQRLLVLTFVAAMKAGAIDVAEAARLSLQAINPRHQLLSHSRPTDAMTSPDFVQLLASIERQLPFEELERLVVSRPADDRRTVDNSRPLGPQLIAWLAVADVNQEGRSPDRPV